MHRTIPIVGTGSEFTGTGFEMMYRIGLGLCQKLTDPRLQGSEIFSPLHKKSVLCNFRVSGPVGLGQGSGFGLN